MKKATPWLVLIVVLLAAGVWYAIFRQPPATHPSVVDLPEIAPVRESPAAEFPVEDIPPAIEGAPEPEPLPTLEESDSAMIEALASLVGPESLDARFVLQQIISRIVATADSLPSRELAPLVLPLKPVGGQFIAARDGDLFISSPENDARYAPYVQMVMTPDAARVVDLYVRYYPLFQEAYEALGYPDAYFNDRLVEVIDHLLGTPEIDHPILLVKPEAVYVYADETLETLSAGQKIMLRMGAGNAALVREKLREFRTVLTMDSPR